MAYVEKHLQDGETVVHSGKQHWFIYFWPAFVMLNGPTLGAIVRAVYPPPRPREI